MSERVIDVEKCEKLAEELLSKIDSDPQFALLRNYELEAVLAFAISMNSFIGARTEGRR